MAHERFYRNRPPLVRQTGTMSCWAAALVSWMAVARPDKRLDEAAALDAFKPWQTPDGRVELPGLKAIAERCGMEAEETGRGALTPDYLAGRLRRGHLYLTYAPGRTPDIGHTVVLYEVGPLAAGIMDPYTGYLAHPFDFWTSRERAFVGWPGIGGGRRF